jgi:hypothetical protein
VDYESQTISLHLTGAGDAEVKVSDLTDDQLEEHLLKFLGILMHNIICLSLY